MSMTTKTMTRRQGRRDAIGISPTTAAAFIIIGILSSSLSSLISLPLCDAAPFLQPRSGARAPHKAAGASSVPSSWPEHERVRSLRRQLVRSHYRRKRRRRQQQQQRERRRESSKRKGTLVRRQSPTSERVFQWFHDGNTNSDIEFINDNECRVSIRNEYNHDSVGMTNPTIQLNTTRTSTSTSSSATATAIAPTASTTRRRFPFLTQRHDHACNPNAVIPASSSSSLSPSSSSPPATRENEQQPKRRRQSDGAMMQEEQRGDDTLAPAQVTPHATWWPSLPFLDSCNDRSPRNKRWRILKYQRQRVGYGQECYEAIRDAALEWEFTNQEGTKGMMPILSSMASATKQPTTSNKNARKVAKPFPSNSSKSYHAISMATAQPEQQQRQKNWQCTNQGRRYVTYSAAFSRQKSASPNPQRRRPVLLWVINPVRIVYELHDQRGPGTTYSSTAYATNRGHWLQGEERVSVLFRDDTQQVDIEIVSCSRPNAGIGKLIWPFIGAMQDRFFQDQMESLEKSGM